MVVELPLGDAPKAHFWELFRGMFWALFDGHGGLVLKGEVLD